MLFSFIHPGKQQTQRLDLSESSSLPSLQEPVSPTWGFQDKPIRSLLLIRVMKGEGTGGKGRREGTGGRGSHGRPQALPPPCSDVLFRLFANEPVETALTINEAQDAVERREGGWSGSALRRPRGSGAPCLTHQCGPFLLLTWRALLTHLHSGLLKAFISHSANSMKMFLAHKSQPKRQSQYSKCLRAGSFSSQPQH